MSKKNQNKRNLNSVIVKRVTDQMIQQLFPGAGRIKSKNEIPGGSLRRRWKYEKFILEEDTLHGTVEKYRISDGKHMGEYDPQTGKQIKPANPKIKLLL